MATGSGWLAFDYGAISRPCYLDLALFLTGVFPDFSATKPMLPIEAERLIRTLTYAPVALFPLQEGFFGAAAS